MKTDPRPIICGTDFSESSRKAIDAAVAIACRLRVPLKLVHSIDERGEIPDDARGGFEKAFQVRLEAEARRLHEQGFEAETGVLRGVPNDGIVNFAEKTGAQMIILAASETGTVGRWLMGSVSERIAETSPVPTLVIHDAAPFQAWSRGKRSLRIFVAADFTKSSDAALRWVAELQKKGRCDIRLGFIDRSQEDESSSTAKTAINRAKVSADLRARAQWFLGNEISVRVKFGSSQVEDNLLRLAIIDRADVIVLGTHQWHGISRLLHSSISRQILHGASISVVCVPHRNVSTEVAGVDRSECVEARVCL